ncbi:MULTISPECIES: response regulator transcription factor [Paenibacillus]|uniref:DNA-binding response regulator n=1 Tax=Paenibacillus rhizosphaerae TaxID=297318 RepID=A0A1R1EAU9_9BACL|nr:MULTISPECIES: response regulator [Paenibacillus]OMF48941.1 DNA-binding response regulator [Paenibacillus rhizosphaerae]OXL85565.1 DNA-binding response regulator [Paenibacillus sp. SSG-1]UYO06724.1 response regulator [Paenibacillus sp. PSB04]
MFNVLVVDDEHVQREGIKDLISEYRFPFHVLEADNGRAAETILNRHPIDILITDVKMPLMSGLELGRLAKKTQDNLKIVICSGYDEFEYAKTAIKLGVVNYLLKPLVTEEFLEVMEEITHIRPHAGGPEVESEESKVIRQVKEFVKDHFQRDLSLTEVANEVYLSPGYLSILFKKETGMNFSKYLTDLRLRKAGHLLLNSNMKINDIAAFVGIDNTSYFCRLFKTNYGVSPLQYRESGNVHASLDQEQVQ